MSSSSSVSDLDQLAPILEELEIAGPLRTRSDQLAAFAIGPTVIAVIGERPPDRKRIAVAAAQLVPDNVRVIELDPEGALDELWDVAVLVTPADQVLSHVEERLVTNGARKKRVIFVAVDGLQVLGLGKQRSDAIEEIARYRLRPLLSPLDVPWHLIETEGEIPSKLSNVIRQAASDRTNHERTFEASLTAFLNDLLSSLDERVEARKVDEENLTFAQRLLSGQSQRLYDVVRTTVLQGRESFRSANDHLDNALLSLIDAHLAWLRAETGTETLLPLPDPTPVAEAWAELVQCAEKLLDTQAGALRGEIGESATKLANALGPLASEAGQSSVNGGTTIWATDRVERALVNLRNADVSGALDRMEKRVRAERSKADTEQVGGNGDNRRSTVKAGLDEARRLSVAAGEQVAQLLDPMDPDYPIRNELLTGFQGAMTPRIQSALEALSEALESKSRSEVDLAVEELRNTVNAAESSLDIRHRWHKAYLKLVDIKVGRS